MNDVLLSVTVPSTCCRQAPSLEVSATLRTGPGAPIRPDQCAGPWTMPWAICDAGLYRMAPPSPAPASRFAAHDLCCTRRHATPRHATPRHAAAGALHRTRLDFHLTGRPPDRPPGVGRAAPPGSWTSPDHTASLPGPPRHRLIASPCEQSREIAALRPATTPVASVICSLCQLPRKCSSPDTKKLPHAEKKNDEILGQSNGATKNKGIYFKVMLRPISKHPQTS